MIINGKAWEKATIACPQVVTLQEAEDTVMAQVEPDSGDGWRFAFQGRSTVGYHEYKNHIKMVHLRQNQTLRYTYLSPTYKDCRAQVSIRISQEFILTCVLLYAFICAGSIETGL